jgi:hypothetical protein
MCFTANLPFRTGPRSRSFSHPEQWRGVRRHSLALAKTSPLFRAEPEPYTGARLDHHLQGILVKKKKPASLPKKTEPAKSAKDFPAVFAALKKILNPYEKHLSIVRYKPEFYYLETVLACYKGKPVCFGAVRLGKNYVSYYLMPVYMNPELQKRISPELKKRMQGKSCFNFTEVDPVLFRELAALTAAGFTSFRTMKLV